MFYALVTVFQDVQHNKDTPSLILVFFMPEVVIPNFVVISDCGCPFYKKTVSLDTAWPTPAPVATSLRRTLCELDSGTWAGATQGAIHDLGWESASVSGFLCQTRVPKQCSWWKAFCVILFYKFLEIMQLSKTSSLFCSVEGLSKSSHLPWYLMKLWTLTQLKCLQFKSSVIFSSEQQS